MKELDRLKRRSEFLRVQNQGRKWVAKGLILHVKENNNKGVRFGLTVTKRLSKSAVKRNRIKRRLRAIAFDILPQRGNKNFDYVIIGRPDTALRPYKALQNDLKWCLDKLSASTK